MNTIPHVKAAYKKINEKKQGFHNLISLAFSHLHLRNNC